MAEITIHTTAQPKSSAPAAVPHSDTVRRAALSASWTRDRQVARRRIALRWLLWAWWRIGLPLMLVLLLGWLVGWLWQAPASNAPAWLKPLVASAPPATTPPLFQNAPHGKEP